MPDEALHLAIAAIAVVVAGRMAVASTLSPPGGERHPVMRSASAKR